MSSQKQQSEFQDLITTLATEFINLPLEKFDAAITRMLQQIGAFIGADRAYIYHFADDLSTASMIYEWCSHNTQSELASEQNIPTKAFETVFEGFKRGIRDCITRFAPYF